MYPDEVYFRTIFMNQNIYENTLLFLLWSDYYFSVLNVWTCKLFVAQKCKLTGIVNKIIIIREECYLFF